MSRVFAPALGRLVAASAQQPLAQLYDEPAELARFTLDIARRTGATHVLFPFDIAVLAEAAGAQLQWDADVPSVRGGAQLDLADLDAEDLGGAGRWPRAIEAAGYMAAMQSLAAYVPSPALLVDQVGADTADPEQLASAEDLCAGYARALLEAGARRLIVELAAREDREAPSGLRRVAELFDADCDGVAGSDGAVRLSASAIADGKDVAPSAGGARLVLTDHPLAPGTDLGVVAKLATTLSGR